MHYRRASVIKTVGSLDAQNVDIKYDLGYLIYIILDHKNLVRNY